jgi:hypothetical protein
LLVPLVPVAKCHLVTHLDETITSQISSVLQQIQSTNELHATCLDLFHSSPHQISLIDWTVLRRGIAQCHHPFQTTTKLLYGLLPTRKYCHKFKPWTTPYCSYCHDANETFHHLLFCPANSRAQPFRRRFAEQLTHAAHLHKLSFAQVTALEAVLRDLFRDGSVVATNHPS